MNSMVDIYQIVPPASSTGKAFTRAVIDEVLPLVDMGPTRGGQITSQTLLTHEDGRYHWWIAYKTSGGTWVEETIRPARAKLASLGLIYAEARWDILSTATMPRWGEGLLLPLGMNRNYEALVRLYYVSPGRGTDRVAFEQALNKAFFTEPLPPINSRQGHILSHTLLKASEVENRNEERYLFAVLRMIKIDMLTKWGSNIAEMATVRGVEDLRLVQHLTAE